MHADSDTAMLRARRARLARAIGHLLDRNSHRSIGERLGIADTTVARRGEDPHHWPIDDLLDLAVDDEQLANAIDQYMRPRAGAGAMTAESHAHSSVHHLGSLLSDIGQMLIDGRLDESECDELLPALTRARSAIDHLEAAAEAKRHG